MIDSSTPAVSVIIPTYNVEGYIRETLESVLNQEFKDYEVIAVDDGSTDDTVRILKQYAGRIRIVRQRNSGGPARPRNAGIAEARGRYIVIFDSDDLMLPHKLGMAVSLFERKPEVGMVFTDFLMCDEQGTRMPGCFLDKYHRFRGISRIRIDPDLFVLQGRDVFDGLFYENFVGTSGVSIPRHVIESLGGFDEDLSRGGLDDRDMWFRISRRYDVGFIDRPCHVYRVRKGSVSKRTLESIQGRIKVFQRHIGEARSDRVKRQALSAIAANLSGAGYYHLAAGDLLSARRWYWDSLMTSWSMKAFRGLILACLGPEVLNILKRTRAAISVNEKDS